MKKGQTGERAANGAGSISKRTNGTYSGYIVVNGRRKYFSAPNKAQATARQRELLNQRDTGEVAIGKSPRLGDWIELWMTERFALGKIKPSTLNGYQQTTRRNIIPALGQVRCDELRIEHLESLYATLAARGLAGSTIHQVHSVIRAAMKVAVRRGKATYNPATLVEPPTADRVDKTIMSEADTDAILNAAVGTRYEARWHLALVLGLRPGEATGIEWTHINFSTGVLTIKQQLQALPKMGTFLLDNTKTRAGEREIHLPAYLVDMLMAARMKQMTEIGMPGWCGWDYDGVPRALVFAQKNGQPLRPTLDVTEWQKVLDLAGLPHVSRYTARHTAASIMFADGTDAAVISGTLGHANISFTLDTYVKPVDESKKALASAQERKQKLREMQRGLA